jgi:hypothetical protein
MNDRIGEFRLVCVYMIEWKSLVIIKLDLIYESNYIHTSE